MIPRRDPTTFRIEGDMLIMSGRSNEYFGHLTIEDRWYIGTGHPQGPVEYRDAPKLQGPCHCYCLDCGGDWPEGGLCPETCE